RVRLVGDYRQEKARLLQLLEAGRGIGIQPEILQPSRGETAPVTEFRNNDYPIPIEKHGRSQSVGRAYHFVCLRSKAGWLARQCQTPAWKASDKGVTQLGLTWGIRTTTSPSQAKLSGPLATSSPPFEVPCRWKLAGLSGGMSRAFRKGPHTAGRRVASQNSPQCAREPCSRVPPAPLLIRQPMSG